MTYILLFIKLLFYFLVGLIIYITLLPLIINTAIFYFVIPAIIIFGIVLFFMIKYKKKRVITTGILFLLFGLLSYLSMVWMGDTPGGLEHLEDNFLLIGLSSLLCIFEIFAMYSFIIATASAEAQRYRLKQLENNTSK